MGMMLDGRSGTWAGCGCCGDYARKGPNNKILRRRIRARDKVRWTRDARES